jgi:2-hydroxy-3-keto-5-methylthiopentenyl-1-phosphate phosphatase
LKTPSIKIFCDFDGTVTKNDIWVNSLGKFIKNKKEFSILCDEFSNCQISARNCIRKELDLVEDFEFDLFNEYLEKEELDDYFIDFYEFCKLKNYDLFILSEGLDYYINFILSKFKIKLKFYSNKLILKNDSQFIRLGCEFPYSDENCSWCGMSKRNIILSNANDFENDVSVFIGDGISDSCAANYADIVFAKGDLASYCWKNNITYFEYKNFNDVKNKLIKLTEQGKIKHRQSAKLNRRDVYMGG